MRYLENVIAVAVLSLLTLPINNCLAQTMPTPAEMAEQQANFGALINQIPKNIKAKERLAPNYARGVQLPKADPAEIANRYAKAGKVQTGTDLMVFISLAMPREVIMELSKQAKQHGATLVMRGFTGESMTKTQEIARVLNIGGAVWQVNPDAFKVFKIKTVPTVVLATAGASSILDEGCARPTNFAMVNGNQSIEVALQTIRRKSSIKLLIADADTRLHNFK